MKRFKLFICKYENGYIDYYSLHMEAESASEAVSQFVERAYVTRPDTYTIKELNLKRLGAPPEFRVRSGGEVIVEITVTERTLRGGE